ncbi:hypothetical protein ID47_03620 [Candidatus Paracaedibacter acanthamoebae]|uniref:Uncharacterized protein n=1 Tax=Candidatus Odyssella acanthamoebae TaxID=91604 RepID=A0A077AUH4_9PROT|nr:hypothetical protein ID47_03620 [Candidatus Paracaedibacter acanthamoebae]
MDSGSSPESGSFHINLSFQIAFWLPGKKVALSRPKSQKSRREEQARRGKRTLFPGKCNATRKPYRRLFDGKA